MNYLLDIILAVFIIVIIAIFTKKGCKTVFSLITPLVTFICSYLFGAPLGNFLVGDIMLSSTSGIIEKLLHGVIGDGISFGQLRETSIFKNILDTTVGEGASNMSFFDNATIVDGSNISALSEKIAGPLAEMLARIVGCVVVFILVRVGMFILGKTFSLATKLPVLKQFDGILGFSIGVVSAFAYTWIISLGLNLIIRYNLIGSQAELLHNLAKNSYIMNFFCNLSLFDIINLVS